MYIRLRLKCAACLTIWCRYFIVNLCVFESSSKGLPGPMTPSFLEVLVKNIHFPTVNMVLFRTKTNLISTWFKISQKIENQVPKFKHWYPVFYDLVINICYLVLHFARLKCCPLDCEILEGKQYTLFFPSSLCIPLQCGLTVDTMWVLRSDWAQINEQLARSIQVEHWVT